MFDQVAGLQLPFPNTRATSKHSMIYRKSFAPEILWNIGIFPRLRGFPHPPHGMGYIAFRNSYRANVSYSISISPLSLSSLSPDLLNFDSRHSCAFRRGRVGWRLKLVAPLTLKRYTNWKLC